MFIFINIMGKLPKVSLVTITQYSRFNCLLLLFEQIKLQTYKNIIEWVIVEGSKTSNDKLKNNDNINKLITEQKNNVKFNFVYVKDTENMKLGALRNIGNITCKGDITVCMDDDDYYFNNRIEHAVTNLLNSNYLLAGCSNHLMYDYQLNITIQMPLFGQNHSINSCMAWKKEYLINHSHDPLKEMGEETSFTNNFTEPMVQLDPYSTIITSSHNENTYNKKSLFLQTISVILNTENNEDPNGVHIINTDIENLIDKSILKEYQTIFINPDEKDTIDYDITYICGGLSIKWDPKDNKLGGSEQAVVHLAENWIKQGKSVVVYGEISNTIVNGVVYRNWIEINHYKKYKTVILWRIFGALTFLPFNIQAEKIWLDLHDVVSTVKLLCNKYSNKIDKVFLKSEYHKNTFINFYNIKDNMHLNKLVVVPNGIRIEQFTKNVFKNEDIIRNPFRFCYCSCYTRGLAYILCEIWPIIHKYEPRAELHVYYGMDGIQDENIKNQFKMLLSQPGVMDHGRQPVEIINREKHMSNFQLYITQTIAEIDCISIRESLIAGCIPLLSDIGVFKEREGIHFSFNSEQDKKLVPVKILKLLKNFDEIEKVRTIFKQSSTIVSWEQVAKLWLEHI